MVSRGRRGICGDVFMVKRNSDGGSKKKEEKQ